MTTHSSILAWGIPWTEEPGGATVHGVIKSDTTGHACTQAVDFNSKLFDGTSQVAPVVKNPLANARGMRDMGLIPGSGRSPGVGNGNQLPYSCLGSTVDRGA